MHTIHYIAAEAPNAEEAFDHVEVEFNSGEGSPAEWSDWCVVGGGRWNSNPENQYQNSSNDVISYATEPEKFMETLNRIRKWRKAELNRVLEVMDVELLKSDIVDYISNDCIMPAERKYGDMNSYWLDIAIKMTRDHYFSESHFYDLHEYWGADMSNLLERLDDPARAALQYLVPVDFHF